METIKIFTIYCSTGCTCCSEENHYRGPYRTREEATKAAEGFRSRKLLSSQYSSTGNYSIEEAEGEILPDGRIIISNTYICPGFASDTGDDRLWD
jgi:hypothetical protein